MSDFETFSCNNCGSEFVAYADAEAASTGYCSPHCQTAGEGLA